MTLSKTRNNDSGAIGLKHILMQFSWKNKMLTPHSGEDQSEKDKFIASQQLKPKYSKRSLGRGDF
jgi:hypothetical protein